MKIAVTGAFGFVGSNLIRALIPTSHNIRALVHRRRPESVDSAKVEIVEADVHDRNSLISAFNGIDAVYHLVGIITETRKLSFEKTVVEGTANVVEACRHNGVRKVIYLSALGTSETAETKYHRTKWSAEEIIRGSGLEYVILRPSAIFGPDDKFINMLADMTRRSPIIPVIGDGRYQLQPIYVDDLAKIMVNVLGNAKALNKTIEMGGPEQLQFRAIIALLKKMLKKRRMVVYIPLGLIKLGASVMELFLKPSPVTVDQIKMLVGGNICSSNELQDIFEIELTTLRDGFNKYLR